MKKTLFIKNAAIMTANTLLLRLAGVVFRVWTAAKIGSEGMGLYQLTLSVYMLCSTFASIGIATTVTRMVSDSEALGNTGESRSAVKRSGFLCLLVCGVIIPFLFFKGDFIAAVLLKDSRCAQSVKLCGFALPFVSFCACFKGYFLAKRRTFVPCLSQQIEQAVRIFTVITLLNKAGDNIGAKIAAVTVGDIFAEASACAFLLIFWFKDRKNCKKGHASFKKILHIALPISGGKYINSLLRTFENVLIPAKLTLYYSAKSKALSYIGVIKGMALPILLFPYSVLSAVATLLLPEMSAAAAVGSNKKIAYTAERAVKLTLLFGFGCWAVFYFAGDILGTVLYPGTNAGKFLKILSPLVPLMYLDSISDALLKGLDKQRFTFRVTVSDSVARIILIYLFAASGGMKAFLIIMYASNIYTCGINAIKMINCTGAKLSFSKTVLLPLSAAVIFGSAAQKIVLILSVDGILSLAVFCIICLGFYFAFLAVTGIYTDQNAKAVFTSAKKNKAVLKNRVDF